MWRGLSSLQQPVEYFLVWAAWKVAEVQKKPTNPLQRSGAVLPLSTPLFWVLSGCSLVSTSEVLQDWPFASGCGLMSSMLMWSAGGMSGEQCFPPCTSAEMLHFWNEVCSLHVKWHGTFSQLSWQPTGLAYCMLKSSQGQAFRGKKKKKILRRQLPEFGARLIRTPHCLSETNVLIKSIVVGLDGTKCYWVTS